MAVYRESKWSFSKTPAHDYIGFSTVDNGFYSSEHPAPGSGLKNPLGIVKSSDMGKTLHQLDLYGETDFHVMGVGYQNHAIYVYIQESNQKMSKGMHSSYDEAKTWKNTTWRLWV